MTPSPDAYPFPTRRAEATVLALHLTHAENALRLFTMGEVDSVMDPEGKTYLLRPAQEQLRQSEQRLQAMLDSVADVIAVVDRGGKILSGSRAAPRVLGYELEELVGSEIFKLAHPDDMVDLFSAFMEVAEGFRQDAVVGFRQRARDGQYRPLEASLSKLRDAPAASVVFSFRPLAGSGEKAARHACAPAPGLPVLPPVLPPSTVPRDRFLAMLSHELRTPLTPVLLAVNELLEDERFSEARPALAMMQRNIELQSRLIAELADFAAVGQHKVRMRTESIDAHEAVHFVLEICQVEIAAARIEVRQELRATDHVVLGDSLRLQQIMWNLIKNAVKFSPAGSCLTIASRNDLAGGLIMEFNDRGSGIAPGLLPFIFEPFQQGDDPLGHLHGGLGLGLFIARGLAEAHGGTLTAASEGRGSGATFCLTLKTTAAPKPEQPCGDLDPSPDSSQDEARTLGAVGSP